MPLSMETKPVEDSVPKINNDLAVGDDLEFQRRWWRLETAAWWFFALIVLLDVIGCFGRGPVAKARIETSDHAMTVKYERIERLGTPSILTIDFGGPAIQDGKIQLLLSDSLVKELGNQRVVPQPEASKLINGKILYTFPASGYPASVMFALVPADAGLAHLTIQVPGSEELRTGIFVMP